MQVCRGSLSTAEVARLFGVRPETLRHALCQSGAYFGIRPVKRPNRFLAWPAEQVEAVLRSGHRAVGDS